MNATERNELLETLRARFEQNMHRHDGVKWTDVQRKIEGNAGALKTLAAMEASGGEPDVVTLDGKRGEVLFCDCAKQSPKGRRSVCYDQDALASRKQHKPAHSALGMAADIGIRLLTEEQYRRLQEIEELDTSTSSWIETPAGVRELGGALFCDRRFGMVFVYHNGADSYYAARGFRGMLRI